MRTAKRSLDWRRGEEGKRFKPNSVYRRFLGPVNSRDLPPTGALNGLRENLHRAVPVLYSALHISAAGLAGC